MAASLSEFADARHSSPSKKLCPGFVQLRYRLHLGISDPHDGLATGAEFSCKRSHGKALRELLAHRDYLPLVEALRPPYGLS